jgi:hypothetical protein
MTPLGGEQLATSVRKATVDAAKSAIEGFVAAAILALGDVAMKSVRDHATIGAGGIAETLATAYATDLIGRVVTDADAAGLQIGDVHVSTQLAKFASGDPHLTSPVDDVAVEHKFPFPIAGGGTLEASGVLTLHASCALDGATKELKPTAWAKIELSMSLSTEEKKAGATP